MKLSILLTVITFMTSGIDGANILFFFGLSTYSYRMTSWPLVQKLTEMGHSVTFFSPFPPKNPIENVTEFSPQVLIGKIKLETDFLNLRIEKGVEEIDNMWFKFPDMGINMCKNMMSDPEFMSWVNSSHYDLVYVASVFNECGLGLAYKWNAQYIIYGTTSQFSWWNDLYGFADESATYPEHTLHLPQKMSFYQRIRNTLRSIHFNWINNYYYYPAVDKILRTSLNIPDMPSIGDLHRKSNLIFLNSHFSEEYPRSYPPSVVSIAGMQCTDERSILPQNVQDFIEEEGDNPIVYISLGSFIQYSKMPVYLQEIFITTFRKLNKFRFLWKFDGERPENFPSNVFTSSWMPQQDILAHPKVKAFISHGGKLSTQEAVYHRVPMLVIPIFAEQDYNAEKIHAHGNGIRLAIATLTGTQFESAIHNILTDRRYTDKMQAMSQLFRDRPSKPLDVAVWWTEYVLRHKDTSFLHSYANQQFWYERRLLDVWLFLFFATISAAVISCMLLRKAFHICVNTRNGKEKVA